jgi:predicted PurR-regulated permease PerM
MFAMPCGMTTDRRPNALLILSVGLILLGLWIASGFLPALVWAVVLAIAIDPLFMRLRSRHPAHGRFLLPLVVTLIVALVVLVPLALAINRAAREAHDLLSWVEMAQTTGIPVPDWVSHLPVAKDQAMRWWQQHLATPERAANEIDALRNSVWLTHSRMLGGILLHRATIFVFTLLALFFLLRDRDQVVAQIRRAGDRLFGAVAERIGLQTIRSVRGTIDGLVLVAIGEGAVMVPVYLMLGVPHPLLFAVVTAIAATIPFGAALVFVVAGATLLAQGAIVGTIAVIAIGLVVVGIADHFVRPVLIGGATRLPFLWVLIGILGGVESFGLLGLFVGPAVMAVLVMMWREFVEDGLSLNSPE